MNKPFEFNGTDQVVVKSIRYYGMVSIVGNNIVPIDHATNPAATPLIVVDMVLEFEDLSAVTIVTDGNIFYGALATLLGGTLITLFDTDFELVFDRKWIAARTKQKPGRFGVFCQPDGYIESLLNQATKIISKFGPKTQELMKKEITQFQLG